MTSEVIREFQEDGTVDSVVVVQKGREVEVAVETPTDGRTHTITYRLNGDPPEGNVIGEVEWDGHLVSRGCETGTEYHAALVAEEAVSDAGYRILSGSPVVSD